MIKTITITSSYNAFSFMGNALIFDKIEIFSISNKKILINLNSNLEKTQNKDFGMIGQRDGAWIRLHDKNQVFKDFITDEILIIDSKQGVLIKSLGIIQEFDIAHITQVLWNYLKENNLSFLDKNFFFNYCQKMEKQIKKDFNFLTLNKVNLFLSKNNYEQTRKKVLKRYLEFSLLKNKMENSWEMIQNHLNMKVKYEKK